jgi:hypothetical protein
MTQAPPGYYNFYETMPFMEPFWMPTKAKRQELSLKRQSQPQPIKYKGGTLPTAPAPTPISSLPKAP